MIKLFNKRKDYIVEIIDNKKSDFVQVKAKNNKEAMEMVKDVLLKCPIFGFNSINDFKLKSTKFKRIKQSIKKMIGCFFYGRKNIWTID